MIKWQHFFRFMCVVQLNCFPVRLRFFQPAQAGTAHCSHPKFYQTSTKSKVEARACFALLSFGAWWLSEHPGPSFSSLLVRLKRALFPDLILRGCAQVATANGSYVNRGPGWRVCLSEVSRLSSLQVSLRNSLIDNSEAGYHAKHRCAVDWKHSMNLWKQCMTTWPTWGTFCFDLQGPASLGKLFVVSTSL